MKDPYLYEDVNEIKNIANIKDQFGGDIMRDEIKLYIEKFPIEIVNLFYKLRQLIMEVDPSIEEKMWAKLPTYYLADSFVRLIPFKDHINIEAKAIINNKNKLNGCKITPKGMLQIFVGNEIPVDVLRDIFKVTLI